MSLKRLDSPPLGTNAGGVQGHKKDIDASGRYWPQSAALPKLTVKKKKELIKTVENETASEELNLAILTSRCHNVNFFGFPLKLHVFMYSRSKIGRKRSLLIVNYQYFFKLIVNS